MRDSGPSTGPPLPPHFFRHEYGRLVALLSRKVGLAHLASVEDAVQSALTRAVETWPRSGVPEVPSAWLYRVAVNALLESLRTDGRRRRLLDAAETPSETSELSGGPTAALRGELKDELLRMLFVCCDERLASDSQVVLALKVLCGFGVAEIAQRLFRSESDVYKRLSRARQRLREGHLADLSAGDLHRRRPAVEATLYLLFTEGHLSSGSLSLRRDLCDEALRLATLLTEPPGLAQPPTFALLALMYFHRARMSAREGEQGALLLLEEQDRSTWDAEDISRGLQYLSHSAEGSVLSRYHAEASVAAEHCLAPSLAETNWPQIARAYAWLEQIEPSPLHRLNRALAVAETDGPKAGLDLLSDFVPPAWLEGSHMWAAALADLHGRAGHSERAARHREAALRLAPSEAVREALARRLSRA